MQNADLQADGFGRGVCVRARCEWDSKSDSRVWRLRAPASSLHEAPAAYGLDDVSVSRERRGIIVQSGPQI